MLYLVIFNDIETSREKLIEQFNANPLTIQDWYYCIAHSVFVETNKTKEELRDFLRIVTGKNRIFVNSIKSYYDTEGWMPQEAWSFIMKYTENRTR